MSSSALKRAEPARPRKLVLFDIDGTILWTDGAGRRAVFGALQEQFGTALPGDHRFDGKTDPQIVRRRAERALGHPIDGHDVVVIGDTPADVACGVGIGARAIGVATGRYSVEELEACDAAAVFADLSDTDAVVRAILED